MGQIWLTSDLHLGHAKVARLRGFTSVEDHDVAIMRPLHRMVRANDQLWILGDVAFGDRAAGLARLSELPATLVLIAGNHDPEHPMYASSRTHRQGSRQVFCAVQPFAQINYQGLRPVASHFPYDGDTEGREGDRCRQWRLRDEGAPLLHGHTHSDRRISYSAAGSVQIHVGVDAWGLKPVAIHQALTEAGLL